MAGRLQKYVRKICEGFILEPNDGGTRNKLVTRLNKIPFDNYVFTDQTTDRLVDDNTAFFIGHDSVTRKVLIIVLSPRGAYLHPVDMDPRIL